MMLNRESLYLRQNIQVEPLIDRWYAWPQLIPPANAARNITERHIPIMDSYIRNPQAHASAAKNPKLLGGPFVDLDGKQVEEVRALSDRIKRDRSPLFKLSAALKALDELVRGSAKGYSLHPLYPQVPEILRGYVELVYDLNNQPSFRLFESLLYRSEFYDRSQQSLMLSTIGSDDRPFILSTPRFESEDRFHLPVCFSNEVVDELFRLKKIPRAWEEIRELLRVPPESEALVRGFFTEQAPPAYPNYMGPGVRWRYFGHACILVESQGVSILLDPVLSYTYESSISRFTYLDLPDQIDYMLITHGHPDHVLFETLLQLRHKIKNILVPRNGDGHLQDPSLKLLLENCGFKNVIEINEMQEVHAGKVCITGLPFMGEHADLNIKTKLAWLVKMGPHSLLFAADSCTIEPRLYQHLRREIGEIDALFLGMECDGAPLTWLYGPLLSQKLDRGMDASRRLSGSNCEQGMHIVNTLGCRDVYVYAMGQEPWLNYMMSLKYTEQSRPIVESNKLIKACQEQGIVAERLFGDKEILLEPRMASAPRVEAQSVAAGAPERSIV
jgi:L-ascorbate metabolism protein UlaG (beta-lactamase superfamily)